MARVARIVIVTPAPAGAHHPRVAAGVEIPAMGPRLRGGDELL